MTDCQNTAILIQYFTIFTFFLLLQLRYFKYVRHSWSSYHSDMHRMCSISCIICIRMSSIAIHIARGKSQNMQYYSINNLFYKQYKLKTILKNKENTMLNRIGRCLDLKQRKFHLDRSKGMSYCKGMLDQFLRECRPNNQCWFLCKLCISDHSCCKLNH